MPRLYRRRDSIIVRTSRVCATCTCGKRSRSASVVTRCRNDPRASSATIKGWTTTCPRFRRSRSFSFPERKRSTQIEVSARITSALPQLRRALLFETVFRAKLRRGGFFNPGIVPPRDARRRALSRSISALRASRSNAAFSATPVNSWAVRMRSSSSATVVRMRGINYSIE